MTTLAAYVAARTREDGDCLVWTGHCHAKQHPGGTLNGSKVLIRRAVWEAEHGKIPRGKVVRCTCSTPLCIAHLALRTYQQIAMECGAQGLMGGPVRSARIAAAKRSGKQARITQEDARAIRASDEPGVVLARRYGITDATVSKIRKNVCRREFEGNVWAGLGT